MSALESDGGLVKLESAGAAELRVFDDATGNPLSLATGPERHPAACRFPPPERRRDVQVWYYDMATGLWVEDGNGTFTTVPVGTNTLEVYQVSISHLTWWNVNHPLNSTGCVRGTLTAAGTPVTSVFLQGTGSTPSGR